MIRVYDAPSELEPKLRELLKIGCRKLKLDPEPSINVAFIDKRRSRELNKEYLGRDEPTDVLSFNADEEGLLGEILICADVARNQAKDAGWSLENEVSLLFTHGLLHLNGFDHYNQKDAEKMSLLQSQILEPVIGKARRYI